MLSRRKLFHEVAAGAVGLASFAPAAASAKSDANGPFVLVDSFGDPKAPDDTAAIRKAVEAAARTGGIVVFSGREYRLSDTIDVPSGIHLVGTGAMGEAASDRITGTVLRRTRDAVCLRARGTSFRLGGPMRHSIAIRDICIDGADLASDLMQFVAVSRLSMENCFVKNSKGRLILLWEVFDSRISNCDFEWGGNTAGIPMVELRSGDGMEYTNHVHFVGCRWESYPGTAVALTGANTNKIYFTNCKLESLNAAEPSLTIEGANVVRFSGLQITSGSKERPLRSLIAARSSSFLVGDVVLEHAGWDEKSAQLGTYLEMNDCRAVDLSIYAIDGLDRLAPENYVRLERSTAIRVEGILQRGDLPVLQNWEA